MPPLLAVSFPFPFALPVAFPFPFACPFPFFLPLPPQTGFSEGTGSPAAPASVASSKSPWSWSCSCSCPSLCSNCNVFLGLGLADGDWFTVWFGDAGNLAAAAAAAPPLFLDANPRARSGVFFFTERCEVDGANGDGAVSPYFSDRDSAFWRAPFTKSCIRLFAWMCLRSSLALQVGQDLLPCCTHSEMQKLTCEGGHQERAKRWEGGVRE